VIESQLCRGRTGVTLAQDRATGGREVLGARIAEVVLRGPQAVPVGGGFDPTRIDRDQIMACAGGSGLGQQLLDHHFRLLVFAFAEVVMADPPAGVSPRQHAPWVGPRPVRPGRGQERGQRRQQLLGRLLSDPVTGAGNDQALHVIGDERHRVPDPFTGAFRPADHQRAWTTSRPGR
jgi:hypothetical protein